jgi:hypothetical protein
MADTAVAITAGSGTNVDTRTESTNGNHRQVVVLGDPATNAAVASVVQDAPTTNDYALVVAIHPDSVNANGSAAAAASAPVTASTEDVARVGIITETAPASDTASSGLNGRLQRIAQRITSMVALLPSALGRTTQAASLSVVQASFEYETVAASQTDQILGATGGVGDYLEGLLCVVATAATSQVQIKDGNGSAITVLPNAVGAGVGTYYVPIGLLTVNATTPGWKITTAAGVSVIGTGKFT